MPPAGALKQLRSNMTVHGHLSISMQFRGVTDFRIRILRPHGLSRDVRVLAFCPDDQVEDRWRSVQQLTSAMPAAISRRCSQLGLILQAAFSFSCSTDPASVDFCFWGSTASYAKPIVVPVHSRSPKFKLGSTSILPIHYVAAHIQTCRAGFMCGSRNR